MKSDGSDGRSSATAALGPAAATSPAVRSLPDRLAAAVVSRRWIVLLIWIALLLLLLPKALSLPERLTSETRLEGSQSAEVAGYLETGLGGNQRTAWIAATGLADARSREALAVLSEIAAALKVEPWVKDAKSYLDLREPYLLGENGKGALLLVELDQQIKNSEAADRLRDAAQRLEGEFAEKLPGLSLAASADFLLSIDLLELSEEDARRSELRALPLSFIILLWAFGTVTAALFPIVLAMLAVSLAFGVVVLASGDWQPAILLQNVVSIVGLALGIDYSLLVIARFREQLALGLTGEVAAAAALRRTAPALLLSGSAVAVGFSALLLVPINDLRSIAVGGLVVTLVILLLCTTLLPCLLAWLGPRIDLLRLRRRPAQAPAERRWTRWGKQVARRPWLPLLLGLPPLLLLCLPGLQLRVGLPSSDWLPRDIPSMQASSALEDLGRENLLQRLSVVAILPPKMAPLDPDGWGALRALHNRLVEDTRVARVFSLPAMVSEKTPNEMLQKVLPEPLRRRLLDEERNLALFEVIPAAHLETDGLIELVRDLRSDSFGSLRILVGGAAAGTLDYRDTVKDWFPIVLSLVLGATFLFLLLGFRSLLIPLKAILLNLLSVSASYGALVLIFQEGHLLWLFGLDQPIEGVFPAIPILVFCVVFGISMDYEVFLLVRIAEARQRLGESEAIARGLASTGWLITSAAAIMIVVFGTFAFGRLLPVQMLGLALAVAVLVDATIIRLVIGPALVSLAGRWNWWPGK